MRLIVDHELPPDYYTKEMKGILADGKLISEILSEKCSKLHEHLKNLGNDQNFSWRNIGIRDNIRNLNISDSAILIIQRRK